MADRINRESNLRWVPIADIRVDPETQRTLRPGWVAKHVADFDPEKLGYIVVDQAKDDRYYVIDGQHRIELLRAVGWGDQQVQCELYSELDKKERAKVFLARNDRIAVRTFDKFRIRVTAGDPVAVDIDRIVRAHGLVIDEQSTEGHIRAPASLEWVYKGARMTSDKEAPGALARTLEVITKAWGKGPSALDGDLIKGIGLVCLRYNGEVKPDDLAAKLAPAAGGPPGVIGRARALRDVRGRAIADCIAAVVVDMFNKGKRGSGKVDDWWA